MEVHVPIQSTHLLDLLRFAEQKHAIPVHYGRPLQLSHPGIVVHPRFDRVEFTDKLPVRLDGDGGIAGYVNNSDVHLVHDVDAILTGRLPLPSGLDATAARFVNTVVDVCIEAAAENYRLHVLSGLRVDYVALRSRAIRHQIDELTCSRYELSDRIQGLEYDLNAAWQRKIKTEDRLKAIENTTVVERRRQAESEFNALWGLVPRQFEAIRLGDSEVTATTTRVVISYRDYAYDLGRFLITVPFDSNARTRVESLDQPCPRTNYPHPHIGSDGVPCWGNLTGAYAETRAVGDVFHLVMLVERLLRSYNPASPYVEIERWNPDWTDEIDVHDRCYEDANPYLDCISCSDDGCPHHEDRFDRCWQAVVDIADTEAYERCASCGQCSYQHAAARILASGDIDGNNEMTTATQEAAT